MSKIVLLSNTKELSEKLCKEAELKEKQLEVYSEGELAYKYLCEKNIDVESIIMELKLENVDAIQILKYLKDTDKSKDIVKIVILPLDVKQMYNLAFEYGADYVTGSPKYPEYLLDVIDVIKNTQNGEYELNFYKEFEKRLIRNITDKLHRLGVPSSLKGFRYLLEGIKLLYEHPEYGDKITKVLYPKIALKFNSTPSKVERAMRHALTVCWLRGDIDYINKIFKYSVGQHQDKPTNSTFMITLADYIRLRDSDKLKNNKK